MAEHALTPKELTDIVRTFADSDLQELRLSVGDVELLVSRNEVVDLGAATGPRPPVPATPEPAGLPAPAGRPTDGRPAAEAGQAPVNIQPSGQNGPPLGLAAVLSPAVGVFHRRPSPDEQPYVEAGARVQAGDPVGIMEVMKMFTTVRAEIAGTVKEILVADATMVEYHQALMYLEPDS